MSFKLLGRGHKSKIDCFSRDTAFALLPVVSTPLSVLNASKTGKEGRASANCFSNHWSCVTDRLSSVRCLYLLPDFYRQRVPLKKQSNINSQSEARGKSLNPALPAALPQSLDYACCAERKSKATDGNRTRNRPLHIVGGMPSSLSAAISKSPAPPLPGNDAG